jgi:hypothetical protein
MKCFEKCEKENSSCDDRKCKYWIEHGKCCTILAAKEGPMTLQEIGDIFGVTRMRICQIEKKIMRKIADNLESKVFPA